MAPLPTPVPRPLSYWQEHATLVLMDFDGLTGLAVLNDPDSLMQSYAGVTLDAGKITGFTRTAVNRYSRITPAPI